MSPEAESSSSSNPPPSWTPAPTHPLPQTAFYSVEYPGYVAPNSVSTAITTLGGQNALDSAFRKTSTSKDSLLELNFRPDNPSSHPLMGDVVRTNNLLLKVTKRKYKRKSNETNTAEGEYKTEMVGQISRTALFRSMADYQFQPPPEDPLVDLTQALKNMDVQALEAYRIPETEQNYYESNNSGNDGGRSSLRVFPPPIFGRQSLFQVYNYKPIPASVETSVVDSVTGEERKRLINRQRWKGWAPISITYLDPTPSSPPENALSQAGNADKELFAKLQQLFELRPCWTKTALLNQLSVLEARELTNSKFMLPLICYVFHDGPWRDTHVRLGYDPRTDLESRTYQRIYFRNVANNVERASLISRRQETRHEVHQRNEEARLEMRLENASSTKSHIFDGRSVTRGVATFQLCDIHDAMLRSMIRDEKGIRDACHERDGWYDAEVLDQIKRVLRYKYFHLLEGLVVTDEECEALRQAPENSSAISHPTIPKAGKHNMAKGALPPEEVTAARLRSVIGSSSNMISGGRAL